jgi:hypothetical protein
MTAEADPALVVSHHESTVREAQHRSLPSFSVWVNATCPKNAVNTLLAITRPFDSSSGELVSLVVAVCHFLLLVLFRPKIAIKGNWDPLVLKSGFGPSVVRTQRSRGFAALVGQLQHCFIPIGRSMLLPACY